MTRPEGFLGIWLKGPGPVRAPVQDSNRARYDRRPQACWDAANLRIRPTAPGATCWIRNANDFLGRCESANLSRLLTWRTFARGADRRAISSSSRTSQRGLVNGAPRYMPRGLRLFPAEFAGVCTLASTGASGRRSRGEHRARGAGHQERAWDAVRALLSVRSGERNREKFNRSRDRAPAFSSPTRSGLLITGARSHARVTASCPCAVGPSSRPRRGAWSRPRRDERASWRFEGQH